VAGAVQWVRLATGVRVPYGEQGDADGVPVVFLHPYADSHRFFELALPYLPAGIHAFLPTQRGHGDADKPPSGYSLDELSGDLAAFLDAVGVGRAVVVGHSSGGYVAQRFALDHPTGSSGSSSWVPRAACADGGHRSRMRSRRCRTRSIRTWFARCSKPCR
jgi:pimeloyl-ACP methyl ester carboxylesterase